MTFEFNFVLVGLMQIVGFFVQGCTGFGCTVIAAAVTNGLLGTTEGVPYGTLITLPFLYFLGIKAFKEVSWKDLAKIIVLCMPGILVGNYLFHAINTWNAFSQFRSGVVTPHLWSALAVGAPMAAVGFFVGMAFLKKINKETFLRIVYCVLLFVGANMLITSLLAL